MRPRSGNSWPYSVVKGEASAHRAAQGVWPIVLTSGRCSVAETADPAMGVERTVSPALPVRDQPRGDEPGTRHRAPCDQHLPDSPSRHDGQIGGAERRRHADTAVRVCSQSACGPLNPHFHMLYLQGKRGQENGVRSNFRKTG